MARSRSSGAADISALFPIETPPELLGHFPAFIRTHLNVLENIPLLRFREGVGFVDNPGNHLLPRKVMLRRSLRSVNCALWHQWHLLQNRAPSAGKAAAVSLPSQKRARLVRLPTIVRMSPGGIPVSLSKRHIFSMWGARRGWAQSSLRITRKANQRGPRRPGQL